MGSPDFPLLKAQCGKLIIFNGKDYIVLSIPGRREEFTCMPDTETCWKWCRINVETGSICFVYTAGNDSHFPSCGIAQVCSYRVNLGKHSWIREAVEGCRALGLKALLEKLKWSICDEQTPLCWCQAHVGWKGPQQVFSNLLLEEGLPGQPWHCWSPEGGRFPHLSGALSQVCTTLQGKISFVSNLNLPNSASSERCP